ncbi:hypothetical protein [Sodalis endosymbiont of Henestaris halophilus]|uniref:hypothetical protein n=1 Tax=Sodalis endosymbiont of Henestaris halophilus TaxID=1929246 RepID=UPI000BC01E54|nr:hypothetical protein [Sodalis endosymbiont of Henestaris halophilus]SNC58466.1 hypothetical protein HBA_0195 [Sodalis endosymbiont of Henestaris halophilus]
MSLHEGILARVLQPVVSICICALFDGEEIRLQGCGEFAERSTTLSLLDFSQVVIEQNWANKVAALQTRVVFTIE